MISLLISLFLLVRYGLCRSELAREKPKVSALTLKVSVIVDEHRGQARFHSYTPQRGM